MQIKQSSCACFKHERTISAFSDKSLKLVNHFTYLGSNISSTESMNCYQQVVNCIEIWSLWWNETGFLPSCDCQYDCMDIPPGCLQNTRRKSLMRSTQECCFEQILEATPHKTASKTNQTCWPLLKMLGQTYKQYFLKDSYTWMCQGWPTSKGLYISAICRDWIQEWLMIRMHSERESKISVLSALLEDEVIFQAMPIKHQWVNKIM